MVNEKGMKMIRRRINALDGMNLLELQDQFKELFGFECGATTVIKLRKRLAYKIQEIFLGGITEEDMTILNAIADRDPLANLEYAPPKTMSSVIGTRYRRNWKGVTHEVIVLGGKCFEWEGKTFRSLTAIAREITGNRNWSGKAFFGVKR